MPHQRIRELYLAPTSLDWALAHALNFGERDFFPTPFEYVAAKFDWKNLRKHLQETDVVTRNTGTVRSLLAPKGRYGFRIVTQLDPIDFLLFNAAIYEIAPDIEARRVPVSERRVFSFRVRPDSNGRLFDPGATYAQFQAESDTQSAGKRGFVAVADIADFYLRIYHHRLENALVAATKSGTHIEAIKGFLRGWNGTETYGIPIGSDGARLLSEMTIADVDEALLAGGVNFHRFNDDYRIFAESKSEAYRALSYLADYLYKNHGLTLQSSKTRILDYATFREQYLKKHEDEQQKSIKTKLTELFKDAGIILGDYEQPNFDTLTAKQKTRIASLNLAQLLEEELNRDVGPDLPTVRLLLKQMGEDDASRVSEQVVERIEKLYAALPDVIHFIDQLKLRPKKRHEIGKKLLALLEDSVVGGLDYHRMWILQLFAQDTRWNNGSELFKLLQDANDLASRRQLILAMGRAKQTHWFQSKWRYLFEESPWPRRALLAAGSCMSLDARNHWYNSIEGRLDPLERSVLRWARGNPF